MGKVRILVLIFSLAWVFGSCGQKEPSWDPVADQAGILDPDQRKKIATLTAALLKDLDIELKTVILGKRAQDIDLLANEIFEQEALGRKTKGARGILLLVDPEGGEVRLEIGYDLEPFLTDIFIGYIERKQMAPFFAAGRIGAGIEATVELIAGELLRAMEKANYEPLKGPGRELTYLSGGAGAKAKVKIGSFGPQKETLAFRSEFGPQPNPLAALEKYKQVLRLHIKDPDLGLYTEDSRRFFRSWVVTDAQQDNSLRSLLKAPRPEVFVRGDRAVIRFPVSRRDLPPYFLRRGDGGWMLDFASMNRFIRFNHLNQWYFQSLDHPYIFAFKDLIFDENGFPHPARH
ncbi:TPM domain-containing protein [Thermosulfuriphilus sp.]